MKIPLLYPYALIQPIFNNGKFFCWTNMAWCLLNLIWISGLLLCCRGFKLGGKLSFQIFLTAWTIFFVNDWLNTLFSATESLFYFVLLYIISWFVMLIFRKLLNSLEKLYLVKKERKNSSQMSHSPRFSRFLSIGCGMSMILTIFGAEIQISSSQSYWIFLVALFSGIFGWWYQLKNKKKSIRHYTYENLYQLEKDNLYG